MDIREAFVISSRWVRVPYPALYNNFPQTYNSQPISDIIYNLLMVQTNQDSISEIHYI